MSAERHVVVADPERSVREQLAALVERVGEELEGAVKVHAVETGTEALLEIDRLKPALVLAEVVLAELNGLALLRRVRENATAEGTRPPPFILVTTLVRETDRYWGLRNGAHAYVTKPFDDELLRARIRDVLVAGDAARPEKIGL